jgi:leucyl aminopeptidase
MCHSLQTFKEEEIEVKARMTSVALARNLVNKNADEITPEGFAQAASLLGKGDLKVTVHGKEWIEQQKMGLLLAVSRGSRHAPRFVIMEWKGAPNSKDVTALVGKGITFDSGGLDLKSAENMQDQKSDMAGAAAVMATMKAVRDLNLPINVIALIPLCENIIGGNAYKPGDVYRARSGKMVEIGNTDAEGRLILADALSYAKDEIQPSRIIDVATLTGAAEVALGTDFSALFSNTDSLFFLLEKASIHAGEPLWRMPLHREYLKLLDSDIADCKSVASRRGGAITAAVFLGQFVGDIPWAHFDIAGTGYLNDAHSYLGKGATGVPVRTLVEFLQELSFSS